MAFSTSTISSTRDNSSNGLTFCTQLNMKWPMHHLHIIWSYVWETILLMLFSPLSPTRTKYEVAVLWASWQVPLEEAISWVLVIFAMQLYSKKILPDSPAFKAVWTCKFYCLLPALHSFWHSVGSLEIPLWYGVARICLHPDAPWHSSSLLWSHFFTLTTRDRQIYQHPTSSKDSLPQQGKTHDMRYATSPPA